MPLAKMPLRWGIVTAGLISNDFVNALNSYPVKTNQVITAIAARDKTRATEFAKIHNIEKVFNSYQELGSSNDVGNLLDTGVDESETIILEYSGGRRAVLNANCKLQLCNKAIIYGTKQCITLEPPFHFPDKVIDVDGSLKQYPLHTSEIPYMYQNSAGLVYQTFEVARCIKAGLLESPRLPHKDTLLWAKLMDTIRKQIGVRYDADDEEYL